MRLWVLFGKDGPARFISHLDMQRTFERAFRRAHVPISYSQGFNPHPRFSIASALMLGATGENEVLDVHLESPVVPDEFVSATNSALPAGIRIKAARKMGDSIKDAPALVKAATYAAVFRDDCGWLPGAIDAFRSSERIPFTQKRKDGPREIDARKVVLAVAVNEPCEVTFTLDMSGPTLRPAEVVSVLSVYGPKTETSGMTISEDDVVRDLTSVVYMRTQLLARHGQELVPLFDYPDSQRP